MTTDQQGGGLRRALDENRHLRAEVDRLRADNERLRERLNDLEARLEAALRAGKRQSAPFSRGEPKADPKRPGRKSGEKHGRHGHRPPPEQVDQTVAVEVPCSCPDCGGELDEAGIEEQWQEEILLRAQLARPVSSADSPQGRLLRHLDREFDALFTFLRLTGAPATNWMAEQALRPAIVNRKLWGGNRTWNGARHQERLMTVLRTARQQYRDPVTVLADLIRTPGSIAPLVLPAPG